MGNSRIWTTIAGVLLIPLGFCGCYPYAMGIATPVPVPPWVSERMEEKYCDKNDYRTPILPPIRPGFPPPACEDPPDEAMILRTMPHVPRGMPYVYEQFRDDIQVVAERMKDTIDPPRFFPLVGPAQLHHCHWRCWIYYNETVQCGYPFPFKCVRPRTEVVYIDRDHLHLYPGPNAEVQSSVARQLAGP